MTIPPLLRRIALSLALIWAGQATAADLQVSPVRLEIPNKDASKPLWLTNSGTQPIQVQVTVLKWEQANGKETLTPTNEVVASPAMAQVAPGGRQLVRIVRRGGPAQSEQAYRLRVEELPRADRAPDDNGPALQLLLSYLLPVFLGPEGMDEAPSLMPALGSNTLRLTNAGKKRVMVSDLRAVDAQGKEHTLQPGLVGYVLSGQTMNFPVDLPASTRALRATLNQAHAQDWPLSN